MKKDELVSILTNTIGYEMAVGPDRTEEIQASDFITGRSRAAASRIVDYLEAEGMLELDDELDDEADGGVVAQAPAVPRLKKAGITASARGAIETGGTDDGTD